MTELVLAGGALLLLLAGKKPGSDAKPKPAANEKKPQPKLSKGELEKAGLRTHDAYGLGLTPGAEIALNDGLKAGATVGAVTSTLATAAGAAAGGPLALAAALSTASAVVGGLMTQDKAGTVVGAFAGGGTAFNVGRVLGRELDKLFGGSGDNVGGTSIVSQIAWGVVLAVGACLGTAFGWALFPIALLVEGIGAAVSDSNRLARGQNGAFSDLLEVVNPFYQRMYDGMLARALEKYQRDMVETDLQRIRALAGFVTLGYALQLNAIHKRMWMKRPRGIGVSDEYHLKFGMDRDYWVEKQKWITDWVYYLVSDRKNSESGEMNVNTVRKESPAETSFLLQTGFWQANAEQYISHMADGWGFGQSAESHAKYGRDVLGRYEGEIDTAGDLLWKFVWVYWEETQRNGQLISTGIVGGY